nr:putative RNA-directed DNA polymerase [Tanacetum cinerariifolium]
ERLQAQLGDLKGKSKDTSCVSDTLNPLSQKLENKNVELEFQDTTRGTSANTKFAKQSILRKPPKVGETHALSKPVTSNSIPTPQESKVGKNDKNDREDIGKLVAKGDIGFFIGYSVDSCAFTVYNRRTKKIMETMNVSFNELSAMAFEQCSSKPGLQRMTSGQISSGLDLTYALSTITQQPTKGELNLQFEAMYDDYIGGQPSSAPRIVPAAQAHQIRQTTTTSTSIADTAPTPTISSSQATNFPNPTQDVDGLISSKQHAQQQGNQAPLQPETVADNVPNAMFDANTFVNPFANSLTGPLAEDSSTVPYGKTLAIVKGHPSGISACPRKSSIGS